MTTYVLTMPKKLTSRAIAKITPFRWRNGSSAKKPSYGSRPFLPGTDTACRMLQWSWHPADIIPMPLITLQLQPHFPQVFDIAYPSGLVSQESLCDIWLNTMVRYVSSKLWKLLSVHYHTAINISNQMSMIGLTVSVMSSFPYSLRNTCWTMFRQGFGAICNTPMVNASPWCLLVSTPFWLGPMTRLRRKVASMVFFCSFRDLYLIMFTGLRVAEIHAIFNLPPHLGHFTEPLIYIHWFKPLHHIDDNIGMFQIMHSTWNHQPNAAIIPISQVIQPCHLVPRFSSSAVNPLWNHNCTMTSAETFYLNKYITLHIFEQYRLCAL